MLQTGSRILRDSRRMMSTPVENGFGRLYMWCADHVSQEKVVQYVKREAFTYQLGDGNCVLIDAEWDKLRDLAVPLRRVLTQYEADDLRVLFKPDGGELSTSDFPKVHSFTQYSAISQSSWL